MKPDSPPIYTITTIKFGPKELTVGPNKGKKVFAILDHRVVGFYYDRKDALKTAEGNYGDIYECGSYPYVVIEEVPEGVYKYQSKSWWYKWRDGKYRKTRKPKSYKNVVGFGIG